MIKFKSWKRLREWIKPKAGHVISIFRPGLLLLRAYDPGLNNYLLYRLSIQ